MVHVSHIFLGDGSCCTHLISFLLKAGQDDQIAVGIGDLVRFFAQTGLGRLKMESGQPSWKEEWKNLLKLRDTVLVIAMVRQEGMKMT